MKQEYFKTQREAAEYVGVSLPTFNKLAQSGAIRGRLIRGGEKRKYLKFALTDLDQYKLEREKEALGRKFKTEFEVAFDIAKTFQAVNDLEIERAIVQKKPDARTYHEAVKYYRIEPRYLTEQNLATVCPSRYLEWIKPKFARYKGLPETLRQWVDNQIFYHADPWTLEEYSHMKED